MVVLDRTTRSPVEGDCGEDKACVALWASDEVAVRAEDAHTAQIRTCRGDKASSTAKIIRGQGGTGAYLFAFCVEKRGQPDPDLQAQIGSSVAEQGLRRTTFKPMRVSEVYGKPIHS